MYGLSATPVRGSEPSADSARTVAPTASRPGNAAEASREARDSSIDDTSPFASPRPVQPALGHTQRRLEPPSPPAAGEAAARITDAEVPGSSPGSNPESEQQFFEAGDEGTYAGGPRSELPVPHLDESAHAVPALQRRAALSRHAPARRNIAVVAGVLVLSAAAMIVAAGRHFGAEQQPAEAPEPRVEAAVPQFAPAAVKQPGNTASLVAPPASAVSPGQVATMDADAGSPMALDGSAPSLRAELPAAAPREPAAPAAPPRENGVETIAHSAPRRPAAPRPEAPARPSTAAPAKASSSAEMPVLPPLEAERSQVAPQPVEKPPTAAYPLTEPASF
jgi:hypothetical protein